MTSVFYAELIIDHSSSHPRIIQIWVSLFGFIAAVASFRSGWRATALPPVVPPPLAATVEQTASSEEDKTLQAPVEDEVLF